MGLPVIWRIDRAAPPRASPSVLVRITPVSGRASSKALAVLAASWPVMASTTNRVSMGWTAACRRLISSIMASIDVQPPGGIDDQDILEVLAGRVQRATRAMSTGSWSPCWGRIPRPPPPPGAQLLNGRRAIDVATHHQTVFFCFSWSQRASLATLVVLPEPWRPAISTTAGGCAAEIQDLVGRAHQCDQFVVDDLDQHLTRGQAAHHLLAQRLLAYLVDELAHHRQGDIGLQQGHAHLAQGVLDVVLGQATLATQIVRTRPKRSCRFSNMVFLEQEKIVVMDLQGPWAGEPVSIMQRLPGRMTGSRIRSRCD